VNIAWHSKQKRTALSRHARAQCMCFEFTVCECAQCLFTTTGTKCDNFQTRCAQCITILSNCTVRSEGFGKSVCNLTWDPFVSHVCFILVVSPEKYQATPCVADPKVVQQVTIKQFSHFRETFMPIIDNPLLSGAASEGAKSMMIVAKYASCSASVLQHNLSQTHIY